MGEPFVKKLPPPLCGVAREDRYRPHLPSSRSPMSSAFIDPTPAAGARTGWCCMPQPAPSSYRDSAISLKFSRWLGVRDSSVLRCLCFGLRMCYRSGILLANPVRLAFHQRLEWGRCDDSSHLQQLAAMIHRTCIRRRWILGAGNGVPTTQELARAARVYRTDTDAVNALDITYSRFVDECEELGIETPSARRRRRRAEDQETRDTARLRVESGSSANSLRQR